MAAALHGGAPGPLLAILSQAEKEADQASRALNEAHREVDKVIERARETGLAGSGGGNEPPPPPITKTATGEPEDPDEGYGARIVGAQDEQDEKRSKAARLRRTVGRESADIRDVVKTQTEQVTTAALFHRPPTQAVVAQPTGPTMSSAPTPNPAADATVGFIAGAVFAVEVSRRITQKIIKRFRRRRAGKC